MFSDKYKLYALFTFKCFVALLLSSTVFPHMAFHSLLIFNFPLQLHVLAELPHTFQITCTYVLYMHFECIKSCFLSADMYDAVVLACYAIKALFSLGLWSQQHFICECLIDLLLAGNNLCVLRTPPTV